MKIKTFILATVMALGTCALNAHAAMWTVTTQGTINDGYDSNGIFGAAGQDLTGLTFTQAITASVDPAQWSYNGNGGSYAYMYGNGPSFTDTVTINGNSVTFNLNSTSWGEQFLSSEATQFGGYDEVYSYQSGYTGNSQFVEAYNDAWGQLAFVPSVDFGQNLFTNNQANYFASYFYTDGDLGYTYFDAYNNGSMSLSVNGTNVPEPGSLALLGLGLAGLVAFRRKQA